LLIRCTLIDESILSGAALFHKRYISNLRAGLSPATICARSLSKIPRNKRFAKKQAPWAGILRSYYSGYSYYPGHGYYYYAQPTVITIALAAIMAIITADITASTTGTTTIDR
jgi:hypothetical protein